MLYIWQKSAKIRLDILCSFKSNIARFEIKLDEK